MPESLFQGGAEFSAVGKELIVDLRGYAGAGVQLSGTWAATVTFSASTLRDGTYATIYATPSNSATPATTATANGLYFVSTAGVPWLKVACTAYTSGTIVINVAADISGGGAGAGGGSGGGGAVTIADGADVTEGAIADSKVTGDNSGTVSAKLRGLNYFLGLVTDTVNNWFKVSIQNTSIPVAPAPATSETLSNVAASASNVTLLAAASRKGAIFFNDSTASAYIKLGTTASTSSFTYKVFAYQTVELPTPVYQGQIDAIWESATGSMRVTETS